MSKSSKKFFIYFLFIFYLFFIYYMGNEYAKSICQK